ncbi:BhlA/UviB family holin-like peptide [Mesobacillus sp.]|uniref:BhlA/UviB family holin-like peptide n=1 Tax=Mesobacillus sp. TaxID=2675271 RepID=UPI0039EF171C
MLTLDLTTIPLDQFAQQGIFALLFVWLLFDTRKEAKVREDKLTVQIEKQNEAQDRIVQSLERLETQIQNLKEVK